MKRLPTIDPAQPEETLQGYGCRVLAFVLNTRVTATLSDRDLELADYVYPLAISGPGVSVLAVDRLSAVRHLILAAIATRRAIDKPPVLTATPVPPIVAGGHLVPLLPVLRRNPPAGTVLLPDFSPF